MLKIINLHHSDDDGKSIISIFHLKTLNLWSNHDLIIMNLNHLVNNTTNLARKLNKKNLKLGSLRT